jgi:RNA polymerase sigma-70 factor (ECF subfamily)
LDLPLGTVKSRIFFARKELKTKIHRRYDDLAQIWERNTAPEMAY